MINYMTKFELVNPKSWYSKFTCGNIKSLRDEPKILNLNVYEEMVSFYRKHYVASNMKLVIINNRDLDSLEKIAR